MRFLLSWTDAFRILDFSGYVRGPCRRTSTALLLLATLSLSAGCYTFESSTIEAVRPGMDLRARLSPSGVETVTELTGEPRTSVDGRLERMDGETVVLSVWRTDLIGSNFEPGRLELPLPRAQIVGLEEKRLSHLRTGGVVAGITAGLYLFVRVVWGGVGGILSSGPGGEEI